MAEYWDVVDAQGAPLGRVMRAGTPMNPGEYHPAVSVWVVNSRGEFLISRRLGSADVAAGMWETTSGSVIAGEAPLAAAVRETNEELGVRLSENAARLFTQYTWPHSSGNGAAWFSVWLFRHDVDVSEVKLQATETCDAMWAAPKKIRELISEKKFIAYSYIEELFRFAAEG